MILKIKSTNPSQKIMLIGFFFMLLTVSVLVGLMLYLVDSSVKNFTRVSFSEQNHLPNVGQLQILGKKQLSAIYQIISSESATEQKDHWLSYTKHNQEFKLELQKLHQLDSKFKFLLRQQNVLLEKLKPLNQQIMQLYDSLQLLRIKQLLLNQVIPIQNEILISLHKLEKQIHKQNAMVFKQALDSNQYSQWFLLFLAIFTLLILYTICYRIFRHVSRTQSKLFEEKQRAQVTLHSIADGVILLDTKGYIKEMNKIAESLLAVHFDQVKGCHINQVVDLYAEHDKQDKLTIFKSKINKSISEKSEGWVMLRNKNDDRLAIGYSLSPVKIDQQTIALVCVIHDISAIHQLAKQLGYLANHDELTGLNNRRQFNHFLKLEIAEVQRYHTAHSWLCFIDLDFFKNINDTCGHLAGDQFLQKIAQTILPAVRSSDHVARVGGDEFAAIIRYTESAQEAIEVAERIRTNIAAMKFSWEGNNFDVTASLGLVYLADCANIDDALNKADKACYQSKQFGRNKLNIHQPNSTSLLR